MVEPDKKTRLLEKIINMDPEFKNSIKKLSDQITNLNHDSNQKKAKIGKNGDYIRGEGIELNKRLMISRRKRTQIKKRKALLVLSRGFKEEGIALDRQMFRNEETGRKEKSLIFYVDESILDIVKKERRRLLKIGRASSRYYVLDAEAERVALKKASTHLHKMIKDIQENLNEKVQEDLGSHVEIAERYLDPYRRYYFEHGHFGDPANYQSRLGRIIAWTVGQLEKRLNWKRAEYDLDQRALKAVVGIIGYVVPKIAIMDTKKQIERMIPLGRRLRWYLQERGLSGDGFKIFIGHTHSAVPIGAGPINRFLNHFNQIWYGNSGTWTSSAEKILKNGDVEEKREDWFEIDWKETIKLKNGVDDLDEQEAAKNKSEPSIKKVKEGSEPDIAELYEGILKNITDPDELQLCLLEEVLSLMYTKNVKLVFDQDIAFCRTGDPLLALKHSIEKFKGNKKYKKFLEKLEFVMAPRGELKACVNKYAGQKNTQVFMFARTGKNGGQRIEVDKKMVRSVYIEENMIPQGSYYPLAEIVAITLAQYLEPSIIKDSETRRLKTGLLEIVLEDLNIESIVKDNGTLIFTLIPNAREYRRDELIKRYASLKRFLRAA